MSLSSEEHKDIEKRLGRKPNETELQMLDVMWSEHCSYKTSRPLLKLLPTTGKRVVLGPGFDAGIVDIGDGLCVAFKIESHNHPCALEPYSGAATGVGGIIRDILAVGATPIALVDSLYFGRLSSAHARWLMQYIVKGIGDYGNCVGIPTVAGDTNFDDSFERNCLVNAGCIGIIEKDKIVYGKAKDVGDILVLLGSSTGRDGIHGVTFASKNLHKKSDEERPAVQIPDPFMKKLIIDATLEALETGKVKAVKDFGGGGLVCVTSELAFKGGKGAEIDISQVPLRESNMQPYEVMISESQERMIVSLDKKDLKVVAKIFEKYGIPYSVIGEIVAGDRFIVKDKGKVVAEMPASLLTTVPTIAQKGAKPSYIEKLVKEKPAALSPRIDLALLKLLSSENIASKEWVYQQYDTENYHSTIVKPGQSDATVLRVSDKKAIAVKTDCNYKHAYLDPYAGAAGTFVESATNLAAVGAMAIGFVDNLNYGNPNSPEVFWQFSEGVKGIADAANALEVPCVGGNVSFYNEDDVHKKAIKPAPTIMMVGLIEGLENVTTMQFKRPGESIVVVGDTHAELGGSEYYSAVFNFEGGKPPAIRMEEHKKSISLVLEAIKSKLVTAAHDCSAGGIAVALSEMCIKSNLGAEVYLDRMPVRQKGLLAEEILFSESYGRFILTTSDAGRLLKLAEEKGVSANVVGEVDENKRLTIFEAENSSSRACDCAITSMRQEFEESIRRKMQQ